MNKTNKVIKIASSVSAIVFLVAGVLTYMGQAYWSNFMIGNLWIMASLSCIIEYVAIQQLEKKSKDKEVENNDNRS